jgi:hypothetical protein
LQTKQTTATKLASDANNSNQACKRSKQQQPSLQANQTTATKRSKQQQPSEANKSNQAKQTKAIKRSKQKQSS